MRNALAAAGLTFVSSLLLLSSADGQGRGAKLRPLNLPVNTAADEDEAHVTDKDMTLYFTLFETISLFVTAFVVNFLVLDGRSNYLEGTLLISAYVIIA